MTAKTFTEQRSPSPIRHYQYCHLRSVGTTAACVGVCLSTIRRQTTIMCCLRMHAFMLTQRCLYLQMCSQLALYVLQTAQRSSCVPTVNTV